MDNRKVSVEAREMQPSRYETSNDAEKKYTLMTGVITTIVITTAIPVIPVVLVTGLLLGLIFRNQVEPLGGCALDFSLHNATSPTLNEISSAFDLWRTYGGAQAYYVNYKATTLTTISQWTAKAIPYLTSSIMTLVAFFVAHHILHSSRKSRSEDLPTPRQLTILLGLLSDGGIQPLRDVLVYKFRHRERLTNPIPLAFSALTCVLVFGLLIPLLDTWFGISTTTVQCVDIGTAKVPAHFFGRRLNDTIGMANYDGQLVQSDGLNCLSNQIDFDNIYIPCTISGGPGDRESVYLSNSDRIFPLIAGSPSANQILNYTDGEQSIYFLGDALSDNSIDYHAQSFAVTTQCSGMLDCAWGNSSYAYAAEGPFYCANEFRGKMFSTGNGYPNGDIILENSASPTGIQFFNGSGFSRAITGTSLTPYRFAIPANPMHFATWGQLGRGQIKDVSLAGPGILPQPPPQWVGSGTKTSWSFNCTSTVHEIIYSWTNGQITHAELSKANDSLGGMFAGPWAFGLASLPLQNIAVLATLGDSAEAIIDAWANAFSRSAVAMTAGVMAPARNLAEQSRTTIQLARVPKVPLWILLGVKVAYACAVIGLAIAAIIFANPSESQEVKERLSVKGLAAAIFEPDVQKKAAVANIDDLFSESSPIRQRTTGRSADGDGDGGLEAIRKVGIVRNEAGGWEYITIARAEAQR